MSSFFLRKSLIIFTVLMGFSFLSSAQNELTLEDAITKRFSTLYPERPSQLQWLPEGGEYFEVIETEDEKSTVEATSAESGAKRPLFSLEDLQAALPELELIKMPRLKFTDNNTVVFHGGDGLFVYDLKNKNGKKRFTIPEGVSVKEYNADYSRLAYLMEDNLYVLFPDGTNIKVTSDGGKGIVYGQAVHRVEFGITKGLFWSPDNQRLAFYRMDESMVTDYPIVNTNVIPAAVESVKYPMAGQASHQVKIGIYTLKKPGATYLEIEGEKEQYLTSVTWAPDGRAIYTAVLNRDQNHLKLQRYNPITGALEKTLFEEKQDKYVEPEHGLWFLPDSPREFLWYSERTGFQHLYRYNTEGEYLGAVTSGNWEVKNILGFDNTGNYLFMTGTGETVINGPKTDRTRSGLHRFVYMVDFQLSGRFLVDSTLATHRGMLSNGGQYLIDQFHSRETPLKMNMFATTGRMIRTVHEAANPLASYGLPKAKFFEVIAEDGNVLYGRMIKPSNFDPAKTYPVMWYVYGGPHAQLVTESWLAGAPLWMYWMAEQGYIVATVDNRGSSNRGLEFEQVTFRNLGQREMVDQKMAIDQLVAEPWADKNRVAIHGWSYGGFMTINMMETWPEFFAAGVAGGPVCDWSLYEIMYTERYMDTPETNPEGFQQANLVSKAKNIQRPLLVIHGTVDDVVVWQHSQNLVKACVDEGVQLDYFLYPGHPHNVRGKDRVHLMQKVFNYVDSQVGVGVGVGIGVDK